MDENSLTSPAAITFKAGHIRERIPVKEETMLVEIKNRFSGQIIISGKYASIKKCLEDNGGADLREANLCEANLRGADLGGANLRGADLGEADLRGADLRGADLGEADLMGADLRGADLGEADLMGANLGKANLGGANLDFSCLHFSCKTLSAKTSEKQRIQLMFHALSWIAHAEDHTEEETRLYNECLEYANRFHRDDVARLKKL